MRTLSLLFLFLFFPFFSESLIITEIQIEGETPDECYIKIHNPGERPVDATGYRLRKKSSTGRDYSVRVFPENSVIDKKGYFLWASSRNEAFPEEKGADILSGQYLSYNNSIALFDREGNILDAVGWGEGEDPYFSGTVLPNPGEDQIIKRAKEDGEYLRTGNSLDDFFFYPPSPSPLQIEDFYQEEKEEEKTSPFFTSIITSFFAALLILYLKRKIYGKNGRTQPL